MIQGVLNVLRNVYFRWVVRLSYKRYDPRQQSVRELVVPPASLCCFSLSANNVKYIRTEDGVDYFREMICRTPMAEYLSALIDDYFFLAQHERTPDNFTQDIPIEIHFPEEVRAEFEAYVQHCRRRPGFYREFAQLGEVMSRAGYSMWRPGTRITREMLEQCGFPDCPDAALRVFPDFVSFVRSGIDQYRRSSLAGEGGMDSFNACRTIATKIVAEALGMGRLIPSAEVVHLHAGESAMYGVLCGRCPGMRAQDAPWEPAPALQRDLADLQVLDALCHQNDHWLNNYNVYERAGRAVGAMAFDNDNIWTFFPSPSVSYPSGGGGAPLLGKDGLIRMPHLSVETAGRLQDCDIHRLSQALRPYLNRLQLWALRLRLRALIRAVRRTSASRPDFLLGEDGWTEQSLQQECSGAFGRTYTYLYATTRDCCIPGNGETRA